MIKILFLNNEGAGFADYLDIEEGTSVEKFFAKRFSGRGASEFLIRVNRQPVARDYVLKDGDRITVTPTKIEGA